MVSDEELQRYSELREIVRRLRAPDGCPWDREQTHASLRPFLLQEAYEVLAALDEGQIDGLPDEMGDLLWQILIHTQLAEEAGEYTMTDVLTAIAAKLVRRHPHVFGEEQVATAAEVVERWDAIKREERSDEASALHGVPKAMPALALAEEVLGRAARTGFAWPEKEDVIEKVAEELAELASAGSRDKRAEEFGDLLLNLANYARYIDVDAEEALRMAVGKFRKRFGAVESIARASERPFSEMSKEELLALWAQAKERE